MTQAVEGENISPTAKLWGMVTSNWISQALYTAAELGIPDLLAGGAMNSGMLAAACGASEPHLERLLRALATIDILKARDDGFFTLTDLGAYLRSDHPASLYYWTLYSGRHLWNIWGHLLDSVKTGKSAQELIYGSTGFGHLEAREALADTFNKGMVELTRVVSDSVVRTYDFSRFQRLMDVGGGYGQLLAAILLANPASTGVLFDLPRVFEAGKKAMADFGLAERCEVVSGSFFETIPPGCDVYLMKAIIHDWPDDLSLQILANCRTAMAGAGKLILIDRIYPDRIEANLENQMIARMDLTMMLGPGGKERTEGQWRSLLQTAGFTINRIMPLEMGFRLIEAEPRRDAARA